MAAVAMIASNFMLTSGNKADYNEMGVTNVSQESRHFIYMLDGSHGILSLVSITRLLAGGTISESSVEGQPTSILEHVSLGTNMSMD
jgi:hypothetical protein